MNAPVTGTYSERESMLADIKALREALEVITWHAKRSSIFFADPINAAQAALQRTAHWEEA